MRVPDDATLAFPDRRGDHRLDTPGNIVVDPRVAPLFMVPPGSGRTGAPCRYSSSSTKMMCWKCCWSSKLAPSEPISNPREAHHVDIFR